jgi:hypothetical protein
MAGNLAGVGEEWAKSQHQRPFQSKMMVALLYQDEQLEMRMGMREILAAWHR